MKINRKIFSKISPKENIEFGLTAILIISIILYSLSKDRSFFVIIILDLIVIIAPERLSPFTNLWKLFSKGLGMIVLAVLLGIIFYFVVSPVGLFRRLMGFDSLQLRQFKRGTRSVLTDRDHLYTGSDLKDTF